MVDIVGFRFTAIRLALLAGISRTIMRGEFREIEFIRTNPLERRRIDFRFL
jgi:hypothetical protein